MSQRSQLTILAPSAISLISRGLALAETCHLHLAIGFDGLTFAFGGFLPLLPEVLIVTEPSKNWRLGAVNFSKDTNTRVESSFMLYKNRIQRNPAEEELEEKLSRLPDLH